MPERYIVECGGWFDDRAGRALTLSLRIAGIEAAGVLILDALPGAYLATAQHLGLSPEERAALFVGGSFTLRGVPVRLVTTRDPGFTGIRSGEVVVALGPIEETFGMIDCMALSRAIIVVPWLTGDCDEWRKR